MTPDWIPNEAIICVYNAAEREFYWSNRAYAAGRKSYNERVKKSKDQDESVVQALVQSKRGKSMDMLLEQWSSFLTGVEPGKFFALVQPKALSGVIRDMEAAEGIESEEMKNYLFAYYAAVSNSEVIEGRGKGKGKNRGKGKGRHPGGKAGVITQMRIEDLKYHDCVTAQKVTIPFRKCENATRICWTAWQNAPLATFPWRHGAITEWQLKSAGWKAVPQRSMAYSPSAKSARCSPESTELDLRRARGTVRDVPISAS